MSVQKTNLAGRLATKIFREEEVLVSNFRGKRNENKLDETKTDTIRRACIVEFPLRSHYEERHQRNEMGWRVKRQRHIGKENY